MYQQENTQPWRGFYDFAAYQAEDELELMEYALVKPKFSGLNVELFADDGGAYIRHEYPLWIYFRNGYSKSDNVLPISIDATAPRVLVNEYKLNISDDDFNSIIDFVRQHASLLTDFANRKLSHIIFFHSIQTNIFEIIKTTMEQKILDLKCLNADYLSPVEILALQQAGVSDASILRLTRQTFDGIVEELGDAYDTHFSRAQNIIVKEETIGIHTITFQDSDNYPEMLNVLQDDRPPLLHCLGNKDLLKRPDSVAIIGARKADRSGNEAAYKLAVECVKRGKVVVSGLALGCDAAAHRGCLDAKGETIAIVATGLDLVHPVEHKSLQNSILQNGGLVLSEQPLGVKANPSRLVGRNRLQAALSSKVVVAQCPTKSGTMHTVNFAHNCNREVYAVKFPIQNEFNSGNFLLLKEQRAQPTSNMWER